MRTLINIGRSTTGGHQLTTFQNKTSVASEIIVDSTYIAQQTMEEVYNLTQKQNFNLQKLKDHYDNQSGRTLHKIPTPSDPQLIVELPHDQPQFKINLHFQPLANDQLSSSTSMLFNIVTTVYEYGNCIVKETAYEQSKRCNSY